MKKSLILVLSMLFVVGLTASAFADVTLGGDARVRGIWKSNYDMNSDSDADDRYYDYRIRLKADVNVDKVQVKSRISLTDWNEAWDGSTLKRTNVLFDYGYLVVPVGPVTVTAGKVVVDWGNKFYVWDARQYRLILEAKAGNGVVKAFTQKDVETRATTGDDNLKDKDTYGLLYAGKFDNFNAGILGLYTNDARTNGKDGQILDVFLNGSAGGVGISAELAYKSGDLNEDSAGNNPVGGFVSVSKGIDALTVSGAFAYAANGYAADDNFTPTVFFGKDQPTAITDFGAASDSTTWVLVGSGTYKVTNDLSVTGRLAYLSAEGKMLDTDAGDESVTELDAGLKYQIAKNTSYSLDLGYLIPSDITTNDDAALALAHKIEVMF